MFAITDQVTSRDITAKAGVSQATVSRALRNSPLVRPETRERIHRFARELNYFVNRNAAGPRTHQSDTLAPLLFDELGGEQFEINPFFLAMLGSITREASARRTLSFGQHVADECAERFHGHVDAGIHDPQHTGAIHRTGEFGTATRASDAHTAPTRTYGRRLPKRSQVLSLG